MDEPKEKPTCTADIPLKSSSPRTMFVFPKPVPWYWNFKVHPDKGAIRVNSQSVDEMLKTMTPRVTTQLRTDPTPAPHNRASSPQVIRGVKLRGYFEARRDGDTLDVAFVTSFKQSTEASRSHNTTHYSST